MPVSFQNLKMRLIFLTFKSIEIDNIYTDSLFFSLNACSNAISCDIVRFGIPFNLPPALAGFSLKLHGIPEVPKYFHLYTLYRPDREQLLVYSGTLPQVHNPE